MKILDKIALAIFSIIILIVSVITLLLIFEWIDKTEVYIIVSGMLTNSTSKNVLLGISIICSILAIKALFFESNSKSDKYNDSIVLENDDGKLIITKETLIGIINGIVNNFDSVKECQTKIFLDNESNLSIILNIQTIQETVIKELINNLQIKIKERLQESLDVEIKNLDVRVKGIIETKEESAKE